jgi:hypothetical protein
MAFQNSELPYTLNQFSTGGIYERWIPAEKGKEETKKGKKEIVSCRPALAGRFSS